MSAGERRLASFLDEVLPRPDWRIYVRPHLDADRPLIAALHPVSGGMFWDVVDWDLEHFRVEKRIWIGDGEVSGRFASPFRFLSEVRSRVYGVYAPEIGEALNDDTRRFRVLAAGLFFPRATTADVVRMAAQDLSARYVDAFGPDALDPKHPGRVIPILGRGRVMENHWFEALDGALTHQRRWPEMFSATPLTPEQRALAKPRGGYTGIEGVAGSGKTIVLAHRAAASAESGRRSLILTFNRTLTNYVRGVLGHVPVAYRPDRVSVLHFHELCRRIHDHYLVPLPPVRRAYLEEEGGSLIDDGADQDALELGWPRSALRVLERHGVPDALRFDAVFVDEAQDFSPEWFELIQRLGASEVVLAYDAAQRLYSRAEAMSRRDIARLFGGNTGRVSRLGKALRLPASTIAIATSFARRWSLRTPELRAAEDGLLPPDAAILTVDVGTPAEAAASTLSVLRSWQASPDYRARDVAIVVPDNVIGEALVRLLAEQGMSTNHVFAVARTGALMETPDATDGEAPWLISRANKTAFAFADARLKVSTVHSFKGWEADRVVFMLPFSPPSDLTAALVFVGLTRSRGELVLVGTVGEHGLSDTDGIAAIPAVIDPQVADRFEELVSGAREARSPRHPERRRDAPSGDGRIRHDGPDPAGTQPGTA